ncbi:MAG TPA: rubrerythrin family protein [Aquifex aeolicus]|uniref:Rubrerythrin family protein n=1 Tax=Aquifex aeolicus TaxID=63363 RepID=A0A7C5L5Y9_AQUAO|nr:rubrerythrin family protein [Aquifex aeolicus]
MNSLVEFAVSFYVGEVRDYLLYSKLAERFRNSDVGAVLEETARTEREHALFWEEFLRRRGVEPPSPGGPPLLHLLLGRLLGIYLIPLLEMGETGAYTRYYRFLKEKGEELSEEEKEKLRSIILEELSHEDFFRRKVEALGLANVRDLVLGTNDGLVELLGVVVGLSAVYRDRPELVGISGVVVGLAGAISMGAGAFISVRSQRQVNEAVREKERILSDLRGAPFTEGVAPEENEIRSALLTGFAYLLGVVFPVSPFFLTDSSPVALLLSISLALVVLSGVGALVALASGLPFRRKITEMVAVAGFAAGVSYLLGALVRSLFGLDL